MSNSIYSINKGVNQPVQFKGLKAQYIWWLGAGITILLVLFAILYIIGVQTFICIAMILAAGIFLFIRVYACSNHYGEHGLKKKIARRSIPTTIHSHSRKIFIWKKN